jgi:hypothetical protein
MYISTRQKIAAIETSSLGIGVSTSVRKYFREYYQKSGVDAMSSLRNSELNDVIAADYQKAQVLHRFKLKSKEVGEFRKSHNFYYLGVIRSGGGKYDVIAVQPSIKQPSEEVRKKRLEQGYGGVIH